MTKDIRDKAHISHEDIIELNFEHKGTFKHDPNPLHEESLAVTSLQNVLFKMLYCTYDIVMKKSINSMLYSRMSINSKGFSIYLVLIRKATDHSQEF